MGSSDFRVQVGFFEHPKVRKLQAKLDYAGVVALLHLYQFLTLQKSCDGMLSGMDSDDIAVAADYRGVPAELVKALTDCRLMDRYRNTYRIHDWASHNPWVASFGDRSAKARHAANVKHGNVEPNSRSNYAPSTNNGAHRTAPSTKTVCPISDSDSDSFPSPTPGTAYNAPAPSTGRVLTPEEQKELEGYQRMYPEVHKALTRNNRHKDKPP